MMNNNINMNNQIFFPNFINPMVDPKQMTLTRLKKEFQLCKQDEDLSEIGCTFGLYPGNDIFKWRVTIFGPEDTPYKGGIFTLKILFPEDYPKRGPEIRFMNKIYHLNVDPKNGHISLSSINEWLCTGKVKSKPCYGVKQALFDIFYLFYIQGCDSPYDEEMVNQYINDREKFNETARQWTQKYAQLPHESIEHN